MKFLSGGVPGGLLTFFLLVCMPYGMQYSSNFFLSDSMWGAVKADVTTIAGCVGGLNLVETYFLDLKLLQVSPLAFLPDFQAIIMVLYTYIFYNYTSSLVYSIQSQSFSFCIHPPPLLACFSCLTLAELNFYEIFTPAEHFSNAGYFLNLCNSGLNFIIRIFYPRSLKYQQTRSAFGHF